MPQSDSDAPIMIERQKELDALVTTARRQGRFAFDTEFVMEDVYSPDVCLVQVATRGRVWLVDTFKKLDLTGIWRLVADPKIVTVVHAGQEDLGIAALALGEPPRNVFDVQTVAGLLGPSYPLSLSKLVRQVAEVRLHKSQTLTDWRKRPFSPQQIRYAAEDVAYLLQITDAQSAQLHELGRTEWAVEECARYEQMELYARPRSDQLMRVKGAGSLDGRQMRIAVDLVTWRDETARVLNRPARAILKDHLLTEIARLGWTDPDQIGTLRGLNIGKRRIRELADVAKQATTKEPLTPHRDRSGGRSESPRESILVALLTAVLRNECDRRNVAYSLVATKKHIQQAVRVAMEDGETLSESNCELMGGWRAQVAGRVIRKVLEGRYTIEVNPPARKTVLKLTRTNSPPRTPR